MRVKEALLSIFGYFASREKTMNFRLQIIILSAWIFLLALLLSLSAIAQETETNADTSGLEEDEYNSGTFITAKLDNLVEREDLLRAGLLYDATRGVILWEKDMNYAYPVASLTKMMVGLLAIEDLEQGKVNAGDKISVTRVLRKSRRSRRTYTVHETYTLSDLLKMSMIASHNEASNWIAKHLAGTMDVFVQRMNDRAQELGMCHTFFSNPSGLPAVIDELDNSSSPHDLLILSLEILRHPELMKISAMPYAEVSNGKKPFQIRNHNGLVREYTGDVDGIKTGYTKNARFCLVATANRSGHRLVGIVLGVSNTYLRNAIVGDMMNAYFETLMLSGLGDTNFIDRTFVSSRLDSLNRKLITQAIRKDPSSVETSNLTQAFDLVPVTERKIHRVRSGDSLSKLAQKYRCTVADIKKWNRLRSNNIMTGQKLAIFHKTVKKVPVKINPKQKLDPEIDMDTKDEEVTEEKNNGSTVTDTTIVKTPEPKPAATEPKKEFIYYTVQYGDTLWNIVQRYEGTDIKQVMKLNNISNANAIKAGMKLKIPKS